MNVAQGKPLAKLLQRILNVFWFLGWVVLLLLVVTAIVQVIDFRGLANTIAQLALVGFVSALQFIIVQLRRILETVAHEKPFTLANVARFRSIGFTTLAIGGLFLARDLYLKGWNTFVILNADDKGVVTNVQVALPFIIGILALILADIFRLGYDMFEENKLTI